ncbi:MAG: hypothetical protein CMK50_06315, partial [Propionibacteriaceae bacterium]|nr:hypothetical protein [Propionibacteriaceae bacterium]
ERCWMVVVMRTEKKVSQGDGYGRAGCPAIRIVKQVCAVCLSLKPTVSFKASRMMALERLKILANTPW